MRDNDTQHVQTPLFVPRSQEIVSRFENKILSVLKNYPPGTTFLAAVSGGADSMAMLAALCAVKAECGLSESDFSFKTAVCHIEHGIRPAEESRGDADFVRAFCESNGIKCRVKHIPPGKIASLSRRKGAGIEAAARFFRHKALSKTAAALGENTVVLLAHTKDDLLETALMRVLRGAGPAGLAAMRETIENMELKMSRRICRPLLSLSRTDVINYLKAKEIVWREDSTNNDEKFLRNRVRRQLVPLLNEAFPSWKAGVAALAETQSLAADFLAGEADSRIKWNEKKFTANQQEQEGEDVAALFSARLWRTAGSKSAIENFGKFIFTSEECFFSQPQIIREEAVFSGINKLSSSRYKIQKKSIKRSVVRRFCAGELNCADLGSVRIKREDGEVFITRSTSSEGSRRTRNEIFECGVSRLIKRCQS